MKSTGPLTANTVNVRDFGAPGDADSSTADAFAAAIDSLADRGGTVYVPPGRYVTGTIRLRSGVHLFLDAGAEIVGSEDPGDYPLVQTRWEGADVLAHAGLIFGEDLHDIAVTGHGTIDGRGQSWWDRRHRGTLTHARPRLVNFLRCRHVRLQGVTLCNSPAWTVNPIDCDEVLIDSVTVRNPADSPNTDGLNPESCRDVRITNCLVDVGDDCITLKAGVEAQEHPRPCENIVISNCVLKHGHGGVVIGSEMAGSVRDVAISNCVFHGTDRGVRIKTRRGRGGLVEDVRISNLVMRDVSCPLTINMFYRCGLTPEQEVEMGRREPEAVTAQTPRIRNIHLSDVTARGVKGDALGCLIGLPEMPICNVTLRGVDLEATPELAQDAERPAMVMGEMPTTAGGWYASHVRGLRMSECRLTGRGGPAIALEDVSDARLTELTLARHDASGEEGGEPGEPVRLRRCRGVRGREVWAEPGGEALVIDERDGVREADTTAPTPVK